MFAFDNSYARLPERFYAKLPPTPVRAPRMIRHNVALATELGIDPAWLLEPGTVGALAGNHVLAGSEPLAQAYAGHQFGNLVPQLGDGRAILLGEVVDAGGVRRDIQLKGSGPTPYSRRGDGRAALGPVLREYLISEAMFALGIPTTRALAAVETGEGVVRERVLPGAVLTRVAASHLRVGTFEFFAVRRDRDALEALVEFAIDRHQPQARDAERPALALLHGVMERQAALVAHWLRVGFIHGVMNTDNTTISGETIDFGPCAFMDTFDSSTVFSSIDRFGRYAYGAQPQIIGWNLARLAETLVPVLDPDPKTAVALAQKAVDGFSRVMEHAWLAAMRSKLGLTSEQDGDRSLVTEFLYALQKGGADFTNACRALPAAAHEDDGADAVRAHFDDPARLDEWLPHWRERLSEDEADPAERTAMMNAANPAFIPRNHLVEKALAAAEGGDLEPFDELLAVLARPYDDQPERARFAEPAPPSDVPYQTFCGT